MVQITHSSLATIGSVGDLDSITAMRFHTVNVLGSRYRLGITPFGVQETRQFCDFFFRNELDVYVWAEPFPQGGVLTGIYHVCSFCLHASILLC